MRALLLSTALLAMPASAFAQALQPITLSPDEYTALIGEMAKRDPVMVLLSTKEAAAQQAAQQAQAKPTTPAPTSPTTEPGK